MSPEKPKPRLWVLPYGLYPRRVTIYLEEKGIADEFDIIPVDVGMNGQQEAAEGKPPGTLPLLELSRASEHGPGKYIFQSTAILEYLEDIYGHQAPDMRGCTAHERARARECADVAAEATSWLLLYIQNGSALYGQMRAQRRGAAEEGLERMHKALSLLETLAEPEEEGPFLVGEAPKLVDCILMASVQFASGVYGVDLTSKHPRLRKAVDAFEGRGTAVFPELPDMLKQMDLSMSV